MQRTSLPSRRGLVAGAIAFSLAVAAGVGVASANTDYGPMQRLSLGAIDFRPTPGAAKHAYVSPGGVQSVEGFPHFYSGLRLPAGARILKIRFLVNPGGDTAKLSLQRVNTKENKVKTVATGTPSGSFDVEAVTVNLDHVVKKGWKYQVDSNALFPGLVVLYGAEIFYRLPE